MFISFKGGRGAEEACARPVGQGGSVLMTASDKPGEARHVPVLREEAVRLLAPRAGGVYVDGTFGAGGHARAVLEVPGTKVLAIDRDPEAIAAGRELERRFEGRLELIEGRFSRMEALLAERGIERVDGILLDLGVSSMQLDEAGRGFSFLRPGPLDMRMEGRGLSAAEVVNSASEKALADILWRLGEERRSRAIARAIVARRARAPITTTEELAEIVEGVLGAPRPGRSHPATRTFQALRIFVNRELEEVAAGLRAAEGLLRPGGRLAVISFHSLEDRIVKRFFGICCGRAGGPSRHLPPVEGPEASFIDLARGGIAPGEAEIARNPRARSARLRGGERTGAPPVAPGDDALGLPRIRGRETG